MKKICLTFLLIATLCFITCSEAPNKGDVCIYFSEGLQLSETPIAKYIVKGKRSKEKFEYTVLENHLCVLYLDPGKWDVNVNAYDANDSIIANCSGWTEVFKSTSVDLSLTLLPNQIISRFEAENYFDEYNINLMFGAEGRMIKFNTTSWIEYKINFTKAGNYKIEYRVNDNLNDMTFDLKEKDVTLGTINTPKTDPVNPWKTVSHTINFEIGVHTLKIMSNNSYFNLNWINISLIPLTPPSE